MIWRTILTFLYQIDIAPLMNADTFEERYQWIEVPLTISLLSEQFRRWKVWNDCYHLSANYLHCFSTLYFSPNIGSLSFWWAMRTRALQMKIQISPCERTQVHTLSQNKGCILLSRFWFPPLPLIFFPAFASLFLYL